MLVFIVTIIFPIDKIGLPFKLKQFIGNIKNVFACWINHKQSIMQTIAGSLGSWMLSGLTICSLSTAINPDADWGYILSIFPMAILAGLIPVTISGIGTRDAAFILLLSSQMTTEQATLIGLGYTILGYWFLAALGLAMLTAHLTVFSKKGKLHEFPE